MDSVGAGRNSGKLFDEMPPCPSDQECVRRRSPSPAVKDSNYHGPGCDVPRNAPSEIQIGIGRRGVPVGRHSARHPGRRALLPPNPCRPRQRAVRVPPLANCCARPRPEFKFSSLSDKGDLMAMPQFPVPKEVGADDLRCVGSFGGWLVGVTPYKDRSDEFFRDYDGECFLVNAFSSKVIRLPRLCNWRFNGSYSEKTLGVVNSPYEVHVRANDVYLMSFCQVVLSASPDSGTKYTVAASSNHEGSRLLALWQPGMTLWHVCCGFDINDPIDLTFYQGKLYLLVRHEERLFTCELEDDQGFMVSRVELCLSELPFDHLIWEDGATCCNMVVWHGELLLIVRHYNNYSIRQDAFRVVVFALDVTTKPFGLAEIHSFNGDCIFVGSGGCKSFPAGLHDGVEGDLIYFVPDDWRPYDNFVYSMRDGRIEPFAARFLASYFDVPVKNRGFPVWLLPTE